MFLSLEETGVFLKKRGERRFVEQGDTDTLSELVGLNQVLAHHV